MTLATIRHPEVREPASLEGLSAAEPGPSPFEAPVNLFVHLRVTAWVLLPQRDNSVTRMASISCAWARAITFLRSKRSFLAPEAVSLKTPTMRWPARLANAQSSRSWRSQHGSCVSNIL